MYNRNFSTRRFSRFLPRNLCSLVMLAVFPLVYAATDIANPRVLISLGLAESRIFPAALVDTSHLILHCPATDSAPLDVLRLITTSDPDRGVPWSSAMPPSIGRGRVNNNNEEAFF